MNPPLILKLNAAKNFTIFLLLILQSTYSFHWDRNILYDLETNTDPEFASEATDWTLSSYVTSGVKYSKCLNDYLIGGSNVLGGSGGGYFERIYSSLPAHNQIYLQMQVVQIDTWDGGSDHFAIWISGTNIPAWSLEYHIGVADFCGQGVGDFKFTAVLSQPHSGSSLTLRVYTNNNEASWNEALGIRNIKIEFVTNPTPYFSLCAPDAPASYLSASRCVTSCTSSGNAITPANTGLCLPTSCSTNCRSCSGTSATCTSCPAGQFLIGTTCYATCDPPLSNPQKGGVIFCDTPCSGQYVWWDGSCFPSCSYSTTYGSYAIAGTTVNGFQVCTYPCATNQFLYGNTSCLNSCPDPLATTPYKSRNFCEYPCTGTNYLYWNGSCLPACSSPLISEIQGNPLQKKFCWYPCNTNDFLHWNGSCLSTCPSPLTPEVQSLSQPRKFCWYKCQPPEHLYWNGSCLPACPSPLSLEIQGTTSDQRNFCWFSCAPNDFLYWNGSCLSSCPSLLTTEIQGSSPQRNFCWYKCQPSEHLYWNGSCLPACPSPLSPEIQGTTSDQRNFCWYPCNTNDFLYWNGSCLSTCPSPLSSETQGIIPDQRKFCWYPCPPNDFLFWNESCSNNCPAPLSSEIQGFTKQRNFCWFPCAETDFLYWNGSCINTCPSPLSPETQGLTKLLNFCWYTCQPSEFLYWNQSCSSNCPLPLVPFDLSGNQFCFLPCDLPNIYWYQDLSCRKECNFPYNLVFRDSVQQCLKPCSRPSEHYYDFEKECHDYCDPPYIRKIINTIKICHIDVSTLKSELDKIKSTSDILEILGDIISIILKAVSVPQLATPRSALLIQVSSLIQYIRYIRINYPWRVQMLFESNGPHLISLTIDTDIPNFIKNKLDNYPLPFAFGRYDLDSNFVNNMWDLLTTASLVVFGIFALLLLKPIFKKNFKINRLFTRILQSLKWNVPIAMICGGSGEIIFYASLYIKNTPLGSAVSIIALLISILMIFFVALILCLNWRILKGFHLQKQKVTPSPDATSDWLKKWKGYEILYEEIDQKSLFPLACIVIYLIRGIFCFSILANLDSYPLTQSILINLINFLVFIYLLYYKPLKNLWATVQLITNEILGDILTICALALAIMDRAQIEARYSRVTLGNVIIVVMIIFYVVGLVFLAIEGILFLVQAYKTWKEMRARGIKNLWKMIQIILFGETKTPHSEESSLELAANKSSRVDTTPVDTQSPIIDRDAGTRARDLSAISDAHLDSSAFFFPIRRLNPTASQISEFDSQITESEMDISRPIRRNISIRRGQNETQQKRINSNGSTSGLILPSGSEPILPQFNAECVQNWGNLRARMKRKNRSKHQIYPINES